VSGLPPGNQVAADEGYSLTVSSAGVKITAPGARSVQRVSRASAAVAGGQLSRPRPGVGPWTVSPITVFDYPRYAHRGLQLDPARNFLSVAEIKSMTTNSPH